MNAIGAYLARTYPKQAGSRTFTLVNPSLYGDFLRRPAEAFLTGLLVLAAGILLAACANLGSLFAARAADRSREVALRLALGSSRNRVLRTLFTEALLISLLGGAVGLAGSVALLHGLSNWQPFPRFPIHVPVSPDANVYLVALLLALASGILFGIVPVRQVLRTDAYQIVKAGMASTSGRSFAARDLLLVGQIAICAVLITSSFVALRGLVRSVNGKVGFEPGRAMLVETMLDMAGYRGEAVPPMQKRMQEALEKVPGVEAVGYVDFMPLFGGSTNNLRVYSVDTVDLRPSNALASPPLYRVSPGYFRAAGTTLLAGRGFTWHDDAKAPRVAVINQEFARRIFRSMDAALGGSFKTAEGNKVQVVGIVENGKYANATEDLRPAFFLPILQSPSSATNFVVRTYGEPGQLTAALRTALRQADPGLPFFLETWTQQMGLALFPARVATVALGILGLMAAMLSVTGVFGMAAYSVSKRLRELGIRAALGARRKEILHAALGRAMRLLLFGSAAGVGLGILASQVLSSIVYQATSRDPLVLAGVVLVMSLLGLLATWIPARRALSVDPMNLLREQ